MAEEGPSAAELPYESTFLQDCQQLRERILRRPSAPSFGSPFSFSGESLAAERRSVSTATSSPPGRPDCLAAVEESSGLSQSGEQLSGMGGSHGSPGREKNVQSDASDPSVNDLLHLIDRTRSRRPLEALTTPHERAVLLEPAR
eukprot:TRINITY_DN5335_c0_g1_i1.p1 TRINITY_DN5335_c0_g1~~TRINITY_DN5335_c0_g1_i1.p1  ORF type:complete len:159 (+),score=24.19 TRINITY_DN5335_c0_g1_i1:46-477(+)